MSNERRQPGFAFRRDILKALSGFGALGTLALLGCGDSMDAGSGGAGGGSGGGSTTGEGGGSTTTGEGSGTSASTGSGSCVETPEETAGPYPDKTGMINDQQYFRQDITEGKTGLPLTVELTVVGSSAACAPISGAIVEIWHCDKDGLYSEYSGQQGVPDQTGTTYLRGLQTTDENGLVTFKTIYPGWYQGRATHIHIEVILDGKTIKTTQLAFPEDVNDEVYATALYTKGSNPMSNAADMVFGDGEELELATMTGDSATGYTAALAIAT